MALHMGHPSEALQVSRGQHPHLPILGSEGSPGEGPGEGLGLVQSAGPQGWISDVSV